MVKKEKRKKKRKLRPEDKRYIEDRAQLYMKQGMSKKEAYARARQKVS